MSDLISDKRLYLNADKTKVVPEGSAEAAYLLVGEGGTVSAEDAEKYGLKGLKEPEQPKEEAGIVVSGGVDSGPSFVKAEGAGDATAAEPETETSAGGATKTAAKARTPKSAK